MAQRADVRPPGSAPASIAAFIALATSVIYVALIVSQGEESVLAAAPIGAYFAGLGVLAFVGGRRARPDRVIPLGAATGGLIGSAMIAIFSIGSLLLAAASSPSSRGCERASGPRPATSSSPARRPSPLRSSSSCS